MAQPTQDLRYIAPVFRVSDLTRSLEFYRGRLRFDVQFVYENFYAEVCRDGCRIHLKCGTPIPRDQTAFEATENIDVCVVVRDASDLWAEFVSADVPTTVPLRQAPYGTEFYVRDPDGYIVGFVEPAP
jgi:catechol 2,3-dioxygenase-like lactoylglutathione lyase family enzyme